MEKQGLLTVRLSQKGLEGKIQSVLVVGVGVDDRKVDLVILGFFIHYVLIISI